jgi:hypothetical protein
MTPLTRFLARLLLKALAFVAIALAGAAACSPAKFGAVNPIISKAVLSSASPSSPSAASISQPAAIPAPILYSCSNKGAAQDGSTALAASSLAVELVSSNGAVACQSSSGVRDSLLNLKQLSAMPPSCSGLAAGQYQVQVVDPSDRSGRASANLLTGSLVATVGADGSANLSSRGPVYVLYDINASDSNYLAQAEQALGIASANTTTSSLTSSSTGTSSGTTSSACDSTHSPLVLDLSPTDQGESRVDLSAPLSGIMFDILGLRSFPYAHAKKLISKITNSSFMFLALPNAQGEVTGIDELFGDDTFGPDGQFAANGYAALAKYDGMDAAGLARLAPAKGHIDASDAVFSSLRLWSDRNGDGVSQPSELMTLQEAGVASINLDYEAGYFEEDQYGNQTRLRSYAQMADGTRRIAFDLYFRAL